MKHLHFYPVYLAVLALNTLYAGAQETDRIWLHGKVINQNDSSAIALAQIASYQLIQTFACDSLGEFRLNLHKDDSIKISALGFEPVVIPLSSATSPDSIRRIALKPISYMIRRVDVSGYREFHDFKDHLKALREKQKELDPSLDFGEPRDTMGYLQATYRSKPPVLAAFFQPLSYIYYYTSPSERSKVKAQKIIHHDKVRSQLDRDMVQEVTKLNDGELDKFMVYCNINIQLSSLDSEESIRVKVIDLYNRYLLENQKQ